MNYLLLVCALSIVSLSIVGVESSIPDKYKNCDFARGAYINGFGRCVPGCPEGTRLYTTGCSYKMPEATCDEPNPNVDKRGMICDFTGCYCESPTVRDKVSGKCVTLENCP